MKRVVIAPNWIGDAVMSLPVLRALRAGRTRRTRSRVLARRGPAAIYRAEGCADSVLERAGLLSDAASLARGRFDEAWLLPNSFRAAVIAFLSGTRRRIGYATDRRGPLLTDALRVRPREPRTSCATTTRSSARAASRRTPIAPRLRIPEAAAESAEAALALAGLPAGRGLVAARPGQRGRADEALAGGALRGPRRPARRAPLELRARRRARRSRRSARGASSARSLRCPCSARTSIRSSSPPSRAREPRRRERLGPDAPRRPRSARPSSRSSGRPIRDARPRRGSPSRVLDRYVFCSPCFLDECPYEHECMKEITVEMALRACEELLARPEP